jgi:hypothetical protein
MKKIILALAICGLILPHLVKKVTTQRETVIHSDGTVTSELDTDVDYVLDLDNLKESTKSRNDVADAVKRGDAAAEKRHEASAKAKSAWKARKLQ